MQLYDPGALEVIFGGALITGFGPDTAITVEYDEDKFGLQIGVSGEAARTKSNNNGATITFTLMPGALGNTILGAAYLADANGPTGGLPLVIRDPSTNTEHVAKGAWIQKDPGAEYAKEVSPKAWTLRTDNLQTLHGFAT